MDEKRHANTAHLNMARGGMPAHGDVPPSHVPQAHVPQPGASQQDSGQGMEPRPDMGQGNAPRVDTGLTGGPHAHVPPGDVPQVPPGDVPRGGVPQAGGAPGGQSGPAGSAEWSGDDGRMLSQVERERLGLQLRQAVTGFVEDPRAAVQEADRAFDAAATRLTELLAEMRQSIRTSWQSAPAADPHGQGHSAADTEALRLALQRYREHTERLLRL